MAYQFGKDIYSQLEYVIRQLDESNKLNKDLILSNDRLNTTILSLTEQLSKANLEIERLKTIINKDSSNSSKPSSTNGFKKVITNRREKSDRLQGGQQGHQFYSLSEDKVNELINKGAKVDVIEVNKNFNNKNKRYRTFKIIDIEFKTVIKEYHYYPDESGNYDIPNVFQRIVYGNNVKGFSSLLMNAFPNSTDGTKEIIKSITNEGIDVSKGTLVNWSNELSDKLIPVVDKIEEGLLNSHYINNDESGLKINGEDSNIICSSNKKYTRLWVSKTKTGDDLESIGFLPKFMGKIVKDGTDIYNRFGTGFSQCGSHILRYLKGIYDFVDHKGPKDMAKFLSRCEEERQNLIRKEIFSFNGIRYNELIHEYDNIINNWKYEWMNNKFNPVYDDERKLLSRMEDSDKEQILYFLKDFKIPFTNNQAEADQRPVKIKQKIGKFRSDNGADNYVVIRSCINTYKKNTINVLNALSSAFENNPVIV